MKETKRRLMSFTFYDRTGIEKKLEEEAAKGWLLEKTSALGWVYRRIEPAKIHFSVIYFPAATAFDPGPSEKQLRFQEFCAHTGWELVASNAQLQIFCNRAEKPIPIETDPEIELQNIHASVKKSFLPAYFMNLIAGFMQIGLFLQRLSWDPIGEMASLPSLLSLVFWCLLIFSTAGQVWMYYSWYLKAKKAARDGNFLETKSADLFQILMLISTSLALVCMMAAYSDPGVVRSMILMMVALLGIIALVLWLSNVMKKRGVSAAGNRVVTYGLTILLSLALCGGMIWFISHYIHTSNTRREQAERYEYNGWTWYVYHDEIPLTIEDLMETDYEGYSYEVISDKASPLLSQFEAYQEPRMDALEKPELHYHVVEVKVSFLYDWALRQMRDEFDHNYAHPEDEENWEVHQQIDPAPWGAEQAWQLVLGGEAQQRYLLCYPDRIVEIDLEWEPTAEQMGIAGRILGTE